MEVVGGVSAILDLIGVLGKSVMFVKQVIDGPKEFKQLIIDLSHLQTLARLISASHRILSDQLGNDKSTRSIPDANLQQNHLDGLDLLTRELLETVRKLYDLLTASVDSKARFGITQSAKWHVPFGRRQDILTLQKRADDLRSKIGDHLASIGLIQSADLMHILISINNKDVERLSQEIIDNAEPHKNALLSTPVLPRYPSIECLPTAPTHVPISEPDLIRQAISQQEILVEDGSELLRDKGNTTILEAHLAQLSSPEDDCTTPPHTPPPTYVRCSACQRSKSRPPSAGGNGASANYEPSRVTADTPDRPTTPRNTESVSAARAWSWESTVPPILLQPNLWHDLLFDDSSSPRVKTRLDASGSVGNQLEMRGIHPQNDGADDSDPVCPKHEALPPTESDSEEFDDRLGIRTFSPLKPFDPGNALPSSPLDSFGRRNSTCSLRLRTPVLLQHVLGISLLTLVLSSSTESHDHNMGIGKLLSLSRARLRYTFPWWFFWNGALDLLQWDSLNSFSLLPRLTHFRKVDHPSLEVAMRRGDVSWVRQQVHNKSLLPGDTVKGIGGPLAFSLHFINSERGYMMARFLLGAGFQCFDASDQNLGAGHMAAVRLLCGAWPPHVEALLQEVIDSSDVADIGRPTALHDAVLGKMDISVREVLAKGRHDLDALDSVGFSALHWAVARQQAADVRTLLSRGAAANIRTALEHWTPLHLACLNEDDDLATLLIASGADLRQEDFQGRTPIHFAAGNSKLYQRLAADETDRFHIDFEGNSALHSLALLPSRGLRRAVPWGMPMARPATIDRNMRLWDLENHRGLRPLHIAATYNPETIVRFEQLGVPMAWPLARGRNILHYAALYWDEAHMDAFLRRHRYEDTFLSVDPDGPDDDGLTPMALLELRMFALVEDRAAGVFAPTRADVWQMVHLIVEAQHARWIRSEDEDQPWAEERQKRLDDGTAKRTRMWVRLSKSQFCRQIVRPGLADLNEIWKPTDWWWRDIDDADSDLLKTHVEGPDDLFA